MEINQQVEIYMPNGNEEQLKDILREFRYIVSWSSLWNKPNKEVYYFNDYLE